MTKGKKSSTTESPSEALHQAAADTIRVDQSPEVAAEPAAMADRNYRKAALEHYIREIEGARLHVCVMCGFGLKAILEVAHLNQKRSDNSIDNLAVLCPNCHKMLDVGLIPPEVVRSMRDYKPEVIWKLRIKDAGAKAAAKRRLNAEKEKRSAVAKKAVASRKAKGNTPS